jgi:serine/threonine protein kinase
LKIIHSDLKPDNIFLVKDNKEDRYKLKIIDVDWAFFSDKQAPWHGTQGYVGTFGYMSPEHIDGKTPSQASDIFTCGIILGQLLTGQHPFHESLDETYNHSAFKGRFSPIMLSSTSNSNEVTVLETLLNLCLDPKPDNRPSAGQVHAALVCVRKNLTY